MADSPLVYDIVPEVISVPEAAIFLSLQPRTLDNWRSQGRGPTFIKLPGGAIRYRVKDLRNWLNTYQILTMDEGLTSRPRSLVA